MIARMMVAVLLLAGCSGQTGKAPEEAPEFGPNATAGGARPIAAAFAAATKVKAVVTATNIKIATVCPATGQCRAIASWIRPKNYSAATDSATIHWEQTAPGVFPDLRWAAPKGTADTLLINRPGDGKTKQGLVTLIYTRTVSQVVINAAANSPVAWSVTAEAAPVDTATNLKVAKLDVKPDSVLLGVGNQQQQQFCSLIVFSDGKVALRSQDASLPTCAAEYAKLSSSTRAVTVAHQQMADSVCVKWSATGGTITSEICNSVGWRKQHLYRLARS